MLEPSSLTIAIALVGTLMAAGTPQEETDDLREVITSQTSAGTVDFPHAMHSVDFEIECVTCHHETNASALSMPHDEYFADFWIDCETCHRAGTDAVSPMACSECHHSSPVDIADETLSAKVVIHKSCFECHEGGTGQDASRSCGSCHQEPEAGVDLSRATAPGGQQDE